MCGIVGYIGEKDATPIILEGLKKLEYRGYDSAGLAVVENGKIALRRNAGKLEQLIHSISTNPLHGKIGVGHTRWATHGEPSEQNAHPHLSTSGEVVVVHNGIVENYLELKKSLQAEGVHFNSETDTETIVHLIEKYTANGNNFEESVKLCVRQLKGAHGIVVISSNEPDKIIAVRIGNAGGVVIGYGLGEMFVASDSPAIMDHTRKCVFLESHQIAIISKNSLEIKTLDGELITPQIQNLSWNPVSAMKGKYHHFMHKEIHEQVRSISDTMAGRVDFNLGKINFNHLNCELEKIKQIENIKIIGCGTAANAGMVGRILIEKIAKISTEVDIASEFRYRDPILSPTSLVIAISQSGETADTLSAMDEAKKKGAILWSIVNAIGSQAIRMADGYISMQVGPEIGVASTKAFTAPLIDLYMLAIKLADDRGTIANKERMKLVSDLSLVPELVSRCLDREKEVEKLAYKIKDVKNILYLGRGINVPIAAEGALKLKEISYIHAESYPAGEMKHGPIALVDREMPVLAIMTDDPWYEKMISQVEQAKARGGTVLLVATDGDVRAKELGDYILWVPKTPWLLNPVVNTIPLQLLAYHIAHMRGLDVDQPRNLAKSVTVE